MYVNSAQNVLGHAVDFAIMSLEIEPNDFGKALIVSVSIRQFTKGNPRYVAGINGCELARQVLDEVHIPYPKGDVMMSSKYDDYLQEQLKDPEFRAEYEALQSEHAEIQALIDTRKENGITQKELSQRTGIQKNK